MVLLSRTSCGRRVPIAFRSTTLALHELATKTLPQYEADNGAQTKVQLSQAKKTFPKANGATVLSSLFEMESA